MSNRNAPITLVIVISKPIKTTLLVHELECWRKRRLRLGEMFDLSGSLPLNESVFGASGVMAVESILA